MQGILKRSPTFCNTYWTFNM